MKARASTARRTLDLAAEVSFEQGLSAEAVGVGWQRAKQWIISQDPEYSHKKRL